MYSNPALAKPEDVDLTVSLLTSRAHYFLSVSVTFINLAKGD